MNVDPELMFECLIYLNVYYFPMLGISQIAMVIAKWKFRMIDDVNLELDSAVVFAVVFAEIGKILIYWKFKEVKRNLVTVIAVLLTFVAVGSVIYSFVWEKHAMKLELILGVLTMMLALTEIVFGFLQILPCYNKVQYY